MPQVCGYTSLLVRSGQYLQPSSSERSKNTSYVWKWVAFMVLSCCGKCLEDSQIWCMVCNAMECLSSVAGYTYIHMHIHLSPYIYIYIHIAVLIRLLRLYSYIYICMYACNIIYTYIHIISVMLICWGLSYLEGTPVRCPWAFWWWRRILHGLHLIWGGK